MVGRANHRGGGGGCVCVCVWGGGGGGGGHAVKALLQPINFTLGPDAKFDKNPTTGSQDIVQTRKCHADARQRKRHAHSHGISTKNQCPPPCRWSGWAVRG